MNKMQNETLHMKRTKEPRLITNDPKRSLINSIFLLFSFPFFLFNVEVGEFRALLIKSYSQRTLEKVHFPHTS